MSDTIKVKVLRQHVFHDGTNMIVLKGGSADVAPAFLDRLIADGAIEAPKGHRTAAQTVADDAAEAQAAAAKGAAKAPAKAASTDDGDAPA